MKDLYKIAYECRNADSTRFWTMFGVMTTINGALLAFVGAHQTTTDSDRLFLLFSGIFGALVCLLWLGMQIRYGWWCEHWDKKLRKLEPLVKEEINAERAKAGLSITESFELFKEESEPKPVGLSTRLGPCLMAGVFLLALTSLVIIATYNMIGQQKPAVDGRSSPTTEPRR